MPNIVELTQLPRMTLTLRYDIQSKYDVIIQRTISSSNRKRRGHLNFHTRYSHRQISAKGLQVKRPEDTHNKA